MPPRIGIEGRDAHQPVHARFGLQPAIGILALDQQRGRFDARPLAFAFLDQLQLVAVALGPARVHAQQHRRPVLAFGAARAGMDFQIAVVGVGLARQHGFQPHAARRACCSASMASFPRPATIAASFSASAISISRVASASSFSSPRDGADSAVSSFWRSRISFWAAAGSFQSAGSSALAFSSSRRRQAVSQSKMPPQQGEGLLDVVDGAFGFGAHGGDIRRSGGKVKPLSRARGPRAGGPLIQSAGPLAHGSRRRGICAVGNRSRRALIHARGRRIGLARRAAGLEASRIAPGVPGGTG